MLAHPIHRWSPAGSTTRGPALCVRWRGSYPRPTGQVPGNGATRGPHTDIHRLSIDELGRAYRGRRLSPVEATETLLTRVDALDQTVESFVTVTADRALRAARRAEAAVAGGNDRGPLLGVPVVLKDLIDTAGVATTASSRVLAGRVPSVDATVWRRLRRAGMVLLGKVHTHEFAYGSATPPTRNPWNLAKLPGGSSGGSAAALAAAFSPAAVGTDTAGSIRIPSGLCGVVGLKPTSGLVSKAGVIPLSTTLDHVGPMARSPRDSGLLLEAMAGYDRQDPSSRRRRGRPAAPAVDPSITGWKVGFITNTGPMTPGVEAGTQAVLAALAEAGAKVDEVTIEDYDQAVDHDFTIIAVEAAHYHRPLLEAHRDLYTESVRSRIEDGFTITGTAYLDALEAMRRYRRRFDDALSDHDVLVAPGMPCPAPDAGADQVKIGGRREQTDRAMCRNTAVSNLTGLPALALPAGFEDGLPVGVQVIGPAFAESAVLAAGQAIWLRLGLPAVAPL